MEQRSQPAQASIEPSPGAKSGDPIASLEKASVTSPARPPRIIGDQQAPKKSESSPDKSFNDSAIGLEYDAKDAAVRSGIAFLQPKATASV